MDEIEHVGVLSAKYLTTSSLLTISINNKRYLVATAVEGIISLFDTSEDSLQKIQETRQSNVAPLSTIGTTQFGLHGSTYMKDSQFLTCGSDKNVTLWDIEVGSVHVVKGSSSLCSIDYSPSNSLCAVSTNKKSVIVFDPRCNDFENANSIKNIHSANCVLVKWDPREKNFLLTAGLDGLALLWDPRNVSQPYEIVEKSNHEFSSLCWNDDQIFIGTKKGKVFTYSTKTEK
ncbi:Ribosome biogenesis protein wdr12 [Thelohanellus kitauei]|uniref:Ribosome biogenesis protein wdr12 n=1 Tax=Thelohanellus kitauei TaxID=669202 RepID=A0A0C2NBP0_THEKT|nr:Ribosome biogenesis protein wdr12 [Thelohanellus kitauei]